MTGNQLIKILQSLPEEKRDLPIAFVTSGDDGIVNVYDVPEFDGTTIRERVREIGMHPDGRHENEIDRDTVTIEMHPCDRKELFGCAM
jgi:hypothetical protein